ncbi:MAG TPA: hypothetical protein PLJ88_02990 [Agitococcus sp.]|nr:hypothetical protein [Agitococcus sp.]
MLAIVRRFLQMLLLFCLAILPVYAQEASSLNFDMPLLIIDLSSVGSVIFLQQAQLWFFLLALGLFVCFVAFLLLRRPLAKQNQNQGDMWASQVLKIDLLFVLLLVIGMSIPLLRVWMVLS